MNDILCVFFTFKFTTKISQQILWNSKIAEIIPLKLVQMLQKYNSLFFCNFLVCINMHCVREHKGNDCRCMQSGYVSDASVQTGFYVQPLNGVRVRCSRTELIYIESEKHHHFYSPPSNAPMIPVDIALWPAVLASVALNTCCTCCAIVPSPLLLQPKNL